MVDEASIEAIIEQVQSKRHDIDLFRANTVRFFETHPNLTQSPQIVHSVRSRMKNLQHLQEKIQRKSSTEDPITPENIFDRVTDIAGVRVLHPKEESHHTWWVPVRAEPWTVFNIIGESKEQ